MSVPINGNLKFSRWQSQQEMQPAFSQGNDLPAKAGDKLSGTGQAVASLPPFPVLLQWLEYYHTQTGNWPGPELFKSLPTEADPGVVAEKPFLTLLPDLNPDWGPGPDHDQTPKKSAGKKNKDRGEEDDFFKGASAYNYRASVYYRAARGLIQKQASRTRVKFPQNLEEETVLTLASFLAWCRYPSFVAENKNEAAEMKMYLPLDRWSKILKIRKATLSLCLNELESAGLVAIDNPVKVPGEPTGRKGNRVYRLAVPLLEPLPVFDPFQSSGNRELPEKFAEPELLEFPLLSSHTVPVPTDMNHVSNIKNIKTKNNKPINHEHGSPTEPGTAAEKLLFLLETASFPGYTSPDGLTTLDKREAQKFAADPRLDLNGIKKIYQQVLSAWTTGKCTRNPIGFFHYSLTRHFKQTAAGTESVQKLSEPASTGNVPGTLSHRNNGSRFHKPTLYKNNRANTTTTAGQARLPFSDIEELEVAEKPESAINNNFTEVLQASTEEIIRRDLQRQVLEALQDRFKQFGLADTLSELKWGISLSERKLRLELENPGPASNFLEIATPGLADISLLKIAISQALRTLTGKSFEIEIVFL